MDHGVRGPDCDHCKRALGPLYKHKIKGNRHLPVFTFDFSGPHPHRVNAAPYLLVSTFSVALGRTVSLEWMDVSLSTDEKLGEEEGTLRENNDAMAV